MRALDDHRGVTAPASSPAASPLPSATFEPSQDWEIQARCRGDDAALFFGPNRFEPKRDRLVREAAAKAICAGCPAVAACRDYALSQGELYGVWGGLGEADLRALQVDQGQPIRAAG